VLGLLLAGCQTAGPEAGGALAVTAPPGPVSVSAIEPQRAVVVARGRMVVLEPLPGLCLTPEAVEVTEKGAFAVVADCLEARAATPATSPFPALITLSVADQPLFADGEDRYQMLRTMRDFLGSAPGLAMLGRDGVAGVVSLIETRMMDDVLYVHVREVPSRNGASRAGEPDAPGLFAPGFWRAFTEVEGRLVLVTVSCFRDRPLDDERMLGLLAAQVGRLRAANGVAIPAEEARLAEPVLAVLMREAGARRGLAAAATVPQAGDVTMPVAVARVQRGERTSVQAPASAPLAPRRPARS
jgi:hypothetical protein